MDRHSRFAGSACRLVAAFLLAAVAIASRASAQIPLACPVNASALETVYMTGLNSRLFFSSSTVIDIPVANPQGLVGLLQPVNTNADTLQFGITIIDYSKGAPKARNADELIALGDTFQIQIFDLNQTHVAYNPKNGAVGIPDGTYFKEFIAQNAQFNSKTVNLARIQISTNDAFAHMARIQQTTPRMAFGAVLGVHRDAAGKVLGCGYLSPLVRNLGFSREIELALTTVPTPYLVSRVAAGSGGGSSGPLEVVEVEPMNVTTRIGTSDEPLGLIDNPPPVAGIATSPSNDDRFYDFAVTFVRYDQNGTAKVFSTAKPSCYGEGQQALNAYPAGTQFTVRIQPFRPTANFPAPIVEAAWNGVDTIVLPLNNTGNPFAGCNYPVPHVKIDVCKVTNFLGPLPGLDRRIRVGLIEGRHLDGTTLVKSGVYNRANRLVAGNSSLSQLTTSAAQPVIFLLNDESVCP